MKRRISVLLLVFMLLPALSGGSVDLVCGRGETVTKALYAAVCRVLPCAAGDEGDGIGEGFSQVRLKDFLGFPDAVVRDAHVEIGLEDCETGTIFEEADEETATELRAFFESAYVTGLFDHLDATGGHRVIRFIGEDGSVIAAFSTLDGLLSTRNGRYTLEVP